MKTKKKSTLAALALAVGMTLGTTGVAMSAPAPDPSHAAAAAVVAPDRSSTRIKEIVQATDNHDGVKGWVYNKTSRPLIVHIGSEYAEMENFRIQPGEDFTYACGVSLNLQFQQSGAENTTVAAEDPSWRTFRVWDQSALDWRTMKEDSFFEYDDGPTHVELKRKGDGNRGIPGESNKYTTDWANLDIVVTDAR